MIGTDPNGASRPERSMFACRATARQASWVCSATLTVTRLGAAGVRVFREAADMPWGERIAFVGDPEGNVVTLAMPIR